MARIISAWCKSAKKALIDKDLTVNELADNIKLSREYTSSIVNGRAHSVPAIKLISDYLNISDAGSAIV